MMKGRFLASVLVALLFGSLAIVPGATTMGDTQLPSPEDISGVHFAVDGDYVEHTPSIIQASNGTFFIAYESGTATWHFTINLTWSIDGISWNDQGAFVSSGGSYGNRHPTLIQRQGGDLQVVYLTDRAGTYQLYTSISPDGVSWTEYGPLTVSGPAVNPFIIQEDNGDFAMSYQRYGSALDGSYFATSSDGISWVTTGSRVSTRALPRLMRASGGGDYLMTFQGGISGDFEIRYKTSSDGLSWSSEYALTNTGNSHDSFPMQLVNGTYMVFFATAFTNHYDLYRKWSPDMSTWSNDEFIDVGNFRFDTEPHAFQLASNQTIILSWGYEHEGAVGAYEDVDVALVWIEDVPVFQVPLQEGWNLISFPLVQADDSMLQVLSSINGQWDMVQVFDAGSGEWATNCTHKPPVLNDLDALDHTLGFWINVLNPCVLTILGDEPTLTTINLAAGNNLVGYPAVDDSAYNVTMLKADTGATIVEGYNVSAPYKISALPDDYVLKRGEGYWVKVPANTPWTVNW